MLQRKYTIAIMIELIIKQIWDQWHQDNEKSVYEEQYGWYKWDKTESTDVK